MSAAALPVVLERIRDMARQADGLELLVLFGSRARGDAHAASDWDFGYLATPTADITGLLAALVEIAGTDRVDLVDLDPARRGWPPGRPTRRRPSGPRRTPPMPCSSISGRRRRSSSISRWRRASPATSARRAA